MDASGPDDSRDRTPAAPPGAAGGVLGSVRYLMMASGLSFILVVNGLIGYGILQGRAEALDAGERATRDLARMLEAQALRTVFAVDQLLADLSFALDTHPEGRTRASPAIHEHLRQRRDAFSQVADLVVIGPDGIALHHSADVPLPAFPLDDRAYFTVQRDRPDAMGRPGGPEGGLYAGPPIKSRVKPGTQVIPFSRRWTAPAGSTGGGDRFGGVIAALVDPSRLAATLESMRIDRKGSVLLALADGPVLLERPRPDRHAPLARLSDWPAVAHALDGRDEATLRAAAPDGRDSLISVRRMQGYPFLVAAALPRDDVLAEWRRDTAAWTAIGAAMTLAIALLTAFVVSQHARREQDQARLAAASRRIRGILDSMLDAVVTFDEDGRIATFNRAAETMFGVPERAMVGQPIEALIPGGRDGANDRDLTALRRDGHAFPVGFTVSELRLGGPAQAAEAPRVFVGVIRDMARRKQQEAELMASKTQAELANRAKSEFLANMSHELRTPLNAIIGFAEILASGFFGTLGDRQQACVKDIHDSGEHLLEIVNAVLDMSKVEAGQLELSEEPVESHEALAQCLMMVRDRAAGGGVELRNQAAAAVATLWVDRRAFKQVILNLLSNAVKFTPRGGSVTIAAGPDEGGGFQLTVTDTGIGIPEDFMPELFQPFRQAENAANRRFEGTGLGLSISKSLIDLHGGSLTCRSLVGIGTSMTIRLPASRVLGDVTSLPRAASAP
ncbi:PAS domain S-box-containing protein [Azospirillum agricola]|uniref:sensor histidine kinase n=1 Tax=Azospirillum agricola TaxID=1720247 RepID=UPI001AE85F62|nr:ATP-binding protein [Azospirillum agricola]MBP2227153.1 PAS domain S-box-containing protein [Azospirillum agricola]